MQLSPHFSLEELVVSSGHPQYVDDNLALAQHEPYKTALSNLATKVLEPLRLVWNSPITINSGLRCPALNKAIHGSATSQHLRGEAADMDSQDNYLLWTLAQKLMEDHEIAFGQCILEKGRIRGGSEGWVHISSPTSSIRGEVLTFDGHSYHLVKHIV